VGGGLAHVGEHPVLGKGARAQRIERAQPPPRSGAPSRRSGAGGGPELPRTSRRDRLTPQPAASQAFLGSAHRDRHYATAGGGGPGARGTSIGPRHAARRSVRSTLPKALPAVVHGLEGIQNLSGNTQQALRDLILLRNAEDANRIAEAANQLSATSNRIAALANTSNIRMLGLAYLALVLGLVSAVVLIPNTAATILGMPSAAWVPGLWVTIVVVITAAIPLVLVFSRPWVLQMLRGMKSYEFRSEEGLGDLPEIPPEPQRA